MKQVLSRLAAGVLGLAIACATSVCAAPTQEKVVEKSVKPVSDSQRVEAQLSALDSNIRSLKNQTTHEQVLRTAAVSLARAENHDTALKFARAVPQRQWDENILDEVWRLRVRRLAWLGKITDANQAAANIKGEFSRADAWLAVARANLRGKRTEDAKTFLAKAEPIIRTSKSALAVSYLAWLWTRADDDTKARALFEFASTIPNESSWDVEILGDENCQRIAFYQAKAGWDADALKTAGDNPRNIVPLRAVFVERQSGGVLHDFASKLPIKEAFNFLLDLAGAQSVRNQTEDATKTLNLARARFAEISKVERESPDGIYLQTVLALLEISVGEEAKGRERFAAISKLPNFNADHELSFYYFQIVPSGFVKIPQTPQQQTANEKAALAALAKMPRESRYNSNYIEIAKVQQERGANAELRETLKLAKVAIQKYVTKKLHEEKDRETLRYVAASQLMQVAQIERNAGEFRSAQSTLAAAMKTVSGESKVRIARLLLDNKFNTQAAVLLRSFVTTTKVGSQEYAVRIEEVPGLAALHAHQSGASAALAWVSKIKTLEDRAETLAKILLVLNPIPIEERELILRGNKLKGAQISSQFSLPGYHVSENFNEFE